MEKILIFAGMALVTYFTRFTMIAMLGREIPPILKRWLRYVPPAVLAALVAPAVFAPKGSLEIGLPVLAVSVGAVAAWKTRNVFATIVAGLAVYWLVRLLF
jgi:branched-subunit amino acid transport protein